MRERMTTCRNRSIRMNCTREVWSEGQLVDLTSLEFDLLKMLIHAGGRVVTREEITAALLERASSPYDRSLVVFLVLPGRDERQYVCPVFEAMDELELQSARSALDGGGSAAAESYLAK